MTIFIGNLLLLCKLKQTDSQEERSSSVDQDIEATLSVPKLSICNIQFEKIGQGWLLTCDVFWGLRLNIRIQLIFV